jgi:hypothetical protein
MDNDIQLKLVENYLLKLRYTMDMKSKNNIDFGYLMQKQAVNKQQDDEKVPRNFTGGLA